MKAEHKLQVVKRERTGSRYAQRERAAGRLPAVLYGHGEDPLALSLDGKEALKFFHAGERVFDIELDGEKNTQTVMLKDIQFDHLGTDVIHVDLARVDLDETIEAEVALRFIGEPVGLRHANAVMTNQNTSITVSCTVRDLVDHIDVKVGHLDVGDSIHVGDLALPPGLTLVSDPDAVVATILEKHYEEEEPLEGTEAEMIEGGPAEPEVISESKEAAGEGETEEGS